MKYPYLLLDADNTLFDFDAGNWHAFHEVCARYDIPDTEESFQCYKRCNNAMWAAFDRGECTKDFLVVERFRRFLKEMGLDRDAARCNELHLQVLGQNTLLLPHALEVCRGLSRELLALCDGTVRIPMSPRCESLNAAVAASVRLWEGYRDSDGRE